MVVSLGPSLGQIQDGSTPHLSWFPLEELLLGALPMLTWVANSMFVRGRIDLISKPKAKGLRGILSPCCSRGRQRGLNKQDVLRAAQSTAPARRVGGMQGWNRRPVGWGVGVCG